MPLYSGELLPRPVVPSCARPLNRPGLQGRHPAEHWAGEGTGQAWVGVTAAWRRPRPLSLRPLFPSSTTRGIAVPLGRVGGEWDGRASQLLGAVTLQNSFCRCPSEPGEVRVCPEAPGTRLEV